jgi:hypothetical protein
VVDLSIYVHLLIKKRGRSGIFTGSNLLGAQLTWVGRPTTDESAVTSHLCFRVRSTLQNLNKGGICQTTSTSFPLGGKGQLLLVIRILIVSADSLSIMKAKKKYEPLAN